jgi:NADH-quinone oxidoreductase subunit K
MNVVPPEQALMLAGGLFLIGMIGLLVRRNIVFVLVSLEIMLNATGLGFVAAGARWGQPDGQIMVILILAMAATEVAVGLALVLLLHGKFKSLDVDSASSMRG